MAALDFDRLRADVADVLGEEPEDIGAKEDLLDLGLDSVRMMALVRRWRADGARVSFLELAEHRTLAEWSALIGAGAGQ